jgi:hypothetical protein
VDFSFFLLAFLSSFPCISSLLCFSSIFLIFSSFLFVAGLAAFGTATGQSGLGWARWRDAALDEAVVESCSVGAVMKIHGLGSSSGRQR